MKTPKPPAFELPMGKRPPLYRFYEMIPGLFSYGVILLLIVLSLVNPLWASVYLLLFILSMFIKIFSIMYHTVKAHKVFNRSMRVNWQKRLADLEDPKKSSLRLANSHSTGIEFDHHREQVDKLAADTKSYPKPSEVYNIAIIALYNESYDVLQPTLQSLVDTTYDKDRLVVVLAYEERGGAEVEAMVKQLVKEYKGAFKDLSAVKHPDGMPNEVVGKGGNITFAGRYIRERLPELGIGETNTVITTLDSDNRPHKTYFDYLTYMYIIHPDRDNLAYQPLALFLNNIWDVPAPMRVAATGNTFWSMIVSMRPYMLRNFAAHAQPLQSLIKTDFWSTRSIVEDGHQYWRSYVAHKGDYRVVPMYVPIYQDAVLSATYWKTMVAQFKQLRRWAYGASDVAYVATQVFSRARQIPFWGGLARLIRAVDSYVTWATLPLMIFLGAWAPLLLNSHAHQNIVAHQLPGIVSGIQQVALVGILLSVYISMLMLPPRPSRYKRRRTVYMVIQWALIPVVSIVFHSMAAFTAQTRLLMGRYLDVFDVTDKATHQDVAREKAKSGK